MASCSDGNSSTRAPLGSVRHSGSGNLRTRWQALTAAIGSAARRDNIGQLEVAALLLLVLSIAFVVIENGTSGPVAVVPIDRPAAERAKPPVPRASGEAKPFSTLFHEANQKTIAQAREALWEFLVTPDPAVRGQYVYRPRTNLASVTNDSDKILPFDSPLLTHLKSWSRKLGGRREIVSAFLVRCDSRREITVEVGIDTAGRARINWQLFKQHAMGEFVQFMTHPFDENRGFFLSVKRTHKSTSTTDSRWESYLISGTNPNQYANVRVKKSSAASKHLRQLVKWDEVCLLRAELKWCDGLFPGDSIEVSIERVIGFSWQGDLDE